jgi:hypothetical protein
VLGECQIRSSRRTASQQRDFDRPYSQHAIFRVLIVTRYDLVIAQCKSLEPSLQALLSNMN